MVELGQDLPLGQEARRQFAVEAGADVQHLDGDVLLEIAGGAATAVNRAHATAAEHVDDQPRAEAGADQPLAAFAVATPGGSPLQLRRRHGAGIEGGASTQQRIDLGAQRGVGAAALVEERRALLRRQPARGGDA